MPVRIRELEGIEDPALLPWLDLYEQSFPPSEKMPVSWHLAALLEPSPEQVLLAGLCEDFVAGMARYELVEDCGGAALWYLAITPGLRRRGLGSQFYQEILDRLRSEGVRGLCFEIEDPARSGDRETAERRIRFYQKNGAQTLGGVAYRTAVPHQAPLEMLVMLHGLAPGGFTPSEALAFARSVLGELDVVGEPALV